MFSFIKNAFSSVFSGGVPWMSLTLVAALLGSITFGIHRIGLSYTYAQEAAEAKANATQIQQAMTLLQAQQKLDVKAVSAEDDAATQRAVVTTIQKEEIKNAPQSDDGPVAPVLSRALNGLRQH